MLVLLKSHVLSDTRDWDSTETLNLLAQNNFPESMREYIYFFATNSTRSLLFSVSMKTHVFMYLRLLPVLQAPLYSWKGDVNTAPVAFLTHISDCCSAISLHDVKIVCLYGSMPVWESCTPPTNKQLAKPVKLGCLLILQACDWA